MTITIKDNFIAIFYLKFRISLYNTTLSSFAFGLSSNSIIQLLVKKITTLEIPYNLATKASNSLTWLTNSIPESLQIIFKFPHFIPNFRVFCSLDLTSTHFCSIATFGHQKCWISAASSEISCCRCWKMAALQRIVQSSGGSGYGSSRAADVAVPDQFPAGLRVLVVDDDITCLRILEQMLRRCLYNG